MVQSLAVTQLIVMMIQSLMMIHSMLTHLALKLSLTLCLSMSLGLLYANITIMTQTHLCYSCMKKKIIFQMHYSFQKKYFMMHKLIRMMVTLNRLHHLLPFGMFILKTRLSSLTMK